MITINVLLEKCYAYATMEKDTLPDEYRVNYDKITRGIEEMACAENMRAVMRLRYRYGHKFNDIAQLLGISYQWVYELHKQGVCFLEKHLFV